MKFGVLLILIIHNILLVKSTLQRVRKLSSSVAGSLWSLNSTCEDFGNVAFNPFRKNGESETNYIVRLFREAISGTKDCDKALSVLKIELNGPDSHIKVDIKNTINLFLKKEYTKIDLKDFMKFYYSFNRTNFCNDTAREYLNDVASYRNDIEFLKINGSKINLENAMNMIGSLWDSLDKLVIYEFSSTDTVEIIKKCIESYHTRDLMLVIGECDEKVLNKADNYHILNYDLIKIKFYCEKFNSKFLRYVLAEISKLEYYNSLELYEMNGSLINDRCVIDCIFNNPTLIALSITFSSGRKIKNNIADKIGELLKNNKVLQILYFNNAAFKTNIFKLITLGIKQNDNLIYLGFVKRCFDIKSMFYLLNSMMFHRSIKTLDISSNKIGVIGADQISVILENNVVLESIILDDNHINSGKGFLLLCDSIAVNKTLKSISLLNNQLDINEIINILEAIVYNTQSGLLSLPYFDRKPIYKVDQNKGSSEIQNIANVITRRKVVSTEDKQRLLNVLQSLTQRYNLANMEMFSEWLGKKKYNLLINNLVVQEQEPVKIKKSSSLLSLSTPSFLKGIFHRKKYSKNS